MTLQGTLNPKSNLSGKIGIPSQETFERIITAAVEEWLDDHPEARIGVSVDQNGIMHFTY